LQLTEDYFARPATELAPDLIGKVLCRRLADGEVLRRRITETECYFGEEDTACHAHKGRTPRTDTLYQVGGCTYVYLCYGIHALLNLVTGAKDHPEAVLIRGVEGASGPGRVTKALGITCGDNRLPLTPEAGIWVEDDGASAPDLEALPRVGIDYAERADRERPWRYLLKN
jgi:DNA-3-methyladenine glycosylase